MAKYTILGAGVIGVTTAYFLNKAGHDVEVIDAAKSAGMGTTYGNGAQLSYSKTFPLSNPKTLRALPYYLFSKNSPVHVKSGFDMQFFRWGWNFLKECTTKKAYKNNDAVLKLALESREAIREILAEHKIDFDFESNGKFYVYNSDEDVEYAKKYLEHQNKLGLDWHMVDIDEAVKKEPALEEMKDQIKGISYCSMDESGDANKFTDQLAKICEQAGVKFHWDAKITDLKAENGKVSKVIAGDKEFASENFVICLGAETPLLLKKIGVYVPIYPMKGYSITVPAGNKAPIISITDEGRRLVYSKLGKRLRVAGIAEFNGYNKKPIRKIMDKVIADASESMPNAGDFSQVVEWTGLRPMSASTVPIIEKHKKFDNLYLNIGQGMLGWTLACASAKRLAGLTSA